MYCPLGHHVLRGPGEFITNPRHIRFVNKMFPDFLPSEKVCAKCKQDVANAYKYKMNRALALRARNATLISSYSTEQSFEDNNNKEKTVNARNVQRQLVASSTTSTTGDDGDGQPSTSAQAAAKRKRLAERQQQQNLLAINLQRGARLPHIQPVARRQRFVHANPDIMDIYLKGTTGG